MKSLNHSPFRSTAAAAKRSPILFTGSDVSVGCADGVWLMAHLWCRNLLFFLSSGMVTERVDANNLSCKHSEMADQHMLCDKFYLSACVQLRRIRALFGPSKQLSAGSLWMASFPKTPAESTKSCSDTLFLPELVTHVPHISFGLHKCRYNWFNVCTTPPLSIR